MHKDSLVSVVLTTYNSPRWLEKVLWGYSVQTYWPFEILIADDGSAPETARLVEQMAERLHVPLQHVWHQHRGFRKPTIVNRCIRQSRGEYLIFSDGDCIPRFDFVAQHVRWAAPNRFLSGGMVRLTRDLSRRITADDIRRGHAHQAAWLVKNGMHLEFKLRMLTLGPKLGALFDCFSTTRPSFNGHNASAWKDDVLRANGFDQRMGYGGLDRELGERLLHAGVRPKRIRHRAICVHLDHDRPYVRAETIDRNNAIRRATRSLRLTRTEFGIDTLDAADEQSQRDLAHFCKAA